MWGKMWLISVSHSSDTIEMLEAALVGEYAKHVGRQNQSGTGGEGALAGHRHHHRHISVILLVPGLIKTEGLVEKRISAKGGKERTECSCRMCIVKFSSKGFSNQ